MELINREAVQDRLNQMANKPLYIHLEMTMGAYTAHKDSSVHPASNFIKNVIITYTHGTITEKSPYRLGLKLNDGWVYTEGLTHWDETEESNLILSGNDSEGRLIIALQLGNKPF